MSEFQVGAISPGPYQPALYGASAHGGRTRRCGPGTAPLVPPERCVAPRRPPATPGDPRPVRCCGRSSGHCRTGALRHHPRPSRQPRLPVASFSYFRPPSPSFLVVIFFSHLFRLPSAAADPREPRSALGHPRAPPPPPTRECLRSPPQSTPLTPTPGVPPPGRADAARTPRCPPAVLPWGRGLPSARGAARTCPGRTQAAPALRDSAPGSVGRGRAATGQVTSSGGARTPGPCHLAGRAEGWPGARRPSRLLSPPTTPPCRGPQVGAVGTAPDGGGRPPGVLGAKRRVSSRCERRAPPRTLVRGLARARVAAGQKVLGAG